MERTAAGGQRTGIPAGLSIAGEVAAAEDLTIDGRVEGHINVPDHHLVIGAGADVTAKLVARAVTISGSVDGSILASENVRILPGSKVRGHVTSPSLMLAEGAEFNGTADPERTEAAMLVARYRQKQTP